MKDFATIPGELEPFKPANEALNIEDGDPLEQVKVTNQAMNAWYGEIGSTIINSGQELTPRNGSNKNNEQLWQAISSNSFKGNVFIDAGGSTSTVINLKSVNPKTYLPPVLGGDPASTATKQQWVGLCFSIDLSSNLATSGTTTVNFKNALGVTVMTTYLRSPFTSVSGGGGGFLKVIDCVIAGDYGVQPRFSYPAFVQLYSDSISSVERSVYRSEGRAIQIFRGSINDETASTTDWNIFTFPVPFAQRPTIICQMLDTNIVTAGQAQSMVRAAFLTVADSDVSGQGFKYIAFNQNGTRSSNPLFYIFAYGYA